MPQTQSAKKALRQSKKKRERNLFYKKRIRELIKEIKLLVFGDKTEEAEKKLPQLYKILDKAAKVNLIKKNTAARKKSRIAKLIREKLKGSKSS